MNSEDGKRSEVRAATNSYEGKWDAADRTYPTLCCTVPVWTRLAFVTWGALSEVGAWTVALRGRVGHTRRNG